MAIISVWLILYSNDSYGIDLSDRSRLGHSPHQNSLQPGHSSEAATGSVGTYTLYHCDYVCRLLSSDSLLHMKYISSSFFSFFFFAFPSYISLGFTTFG